MPQGRRKVPFSGKQKKKQLSEKKLQGKICDKHVIRKLQEDTDDTEVSEDLQHQITCSDSLAKNIQKINLQPNMRSKSNRFVLQFHKETNKELKAMKEEARKPLDYVEDKDLEIGSDFFGNYDFPLRPVWTYEMSKEQVVANENRYFFNYITNIEKMHYDDLKVLNYFELNLETWRQLWRVLELSDIILTICDVRFPSLMFPPYLFHYVTKTLKKNMILVLNKVDLVPSSAVLAWKLYFEETYPGLRIVLFTTCPAYNLRSQYKAPSGLQIRRRRGRMRMAVEGAQQVFQICKDVAADEVDLSSWQAKINEEARMLENQSGDDLLDDNKVEVEKTHEEEKDFEFEEHVRFKNGILTIGCVGFPNVGKSSLLNALMGKKVVSVSKTPGHTKHFQTIFLTNTVRLCDCPGLVFPSNTPRKIQVLLGSYPIAQLREPYASVKYLAERTDLPKLLSLKHPEADELEWSALDICDAWALKRGFLTAKTGRPDSYRAANSILRMALDGKIPFYLTPLEYHKNRDMLQNHEELKNVEKIQVIGHNSRDDEWKIEDFSDSEDEIGAASIEKPVQDNTSNSSDELEESGGSNMVSNQFDMLMESE